MFNLPVQMLSFKKSSGGEIWINPAQIIYGEIESPAEINKIIRDNYNSEFVLSIGTKKK